MQNRDEIYDLLSMHVLNCVLTSRSRVQRHNCWIKELPGKDNGDLGRGPEGEKEDVDQWRNQGYARLKVLVLLPTRGVCWKFVKGMKRLLGDAASVDN